MRIARVLGLMGLRLPGCTTARPGEVVKDVGLIVKQMLSALDYLQEQKIIHRDVRRF